MFANAFDFVSRAVRSGIECSLDDLRQMSELSDCGALEAVRRIEDICASAQIDCTPPISSGELSDRRVFRAKLTKDKFAERLELALASGEGQTCEYKQTLGLNTRRLQNDPDAPLDQLFSAEIIHEVIKTVIAFLNADGGTLLIGICDDGTPYGIENEYQYVGGSEDKWSLRLHAALEAYIPDFRLVTGYVSCSILDVNGCHVCVVLVDARRDRISVCRLSNKANCDELVYRRSGPRTLKLQAREIEALVFDRIRQFGA